MDVHFTDSFSKSLKRLVWHQHWLYRTYATFRYDIPLFLKNIWRFRRELWRHQWWDYHFNLEILHRSLSITYQGLKKRGHEVDETRNPKLKSIERALQLIENKLNDNYVERVEKEVGEMVYHEWEFEKVNEDSYQLVDKDTPEEKAHNKLVFDKARELEEKEWKELWDIFKGTKNSKKFGWAYDGTDMRAWWD